MMTSPEQAVLVTIIGFYWVFFSFLGYHYSNLMIINQIIVGGFLLFTIINHCD